MRTVLFRSAMIGAALLATAGMAAAQPGGGKIDIDHLVKVSLPEDSSAPWRIRPAPPGKDRTAPISTDERLYPGRLYQVSEEADRGLPKACRLDFPGRASVPLRAFSDRMALCNRPANRTSPHPDTSS